MNSHQLHIKKKKTTKIKPWQEKEEDKRKMTATKWCYNLDTVKNNKPTKQEQKAPFKRSFKQANKKSQDKNQDSVRSQGKEKI